MTDSVATLIDRANRARRDSRLPDARRDWVEAVALCRQGDAPRSLVQALKGLGQIERDLGRSDAALLLYEEAVTLCRQGDDPLTLAHTVRHVGEIHRHAGRADLAEPCYQEALAIYRLHPETPPLDLANAIRPFAMLKETAGDLEGAKELWREAKELYASVDVPQGVAESVARLAHLA